MAGMSAEQRAVWTGRAAEYGALLGSNAAAHVLGGIGAADAVNVITARGELGMPDAATKVPARSLARDLGAPPGKNLAADMHAAMTAGFTAAYRARALEIAEAVLPAGPYM